MSTYTRSRLLRLGPFLLPLALGAAAACQQAPLPGEAYSAPADPSLERRRVPSFDEWRRSSEVKKLKDDLYLVEWDIPIRGEPNLRRYYEQRFLRNGPKSAVKQTNPNDPSPLFCLFNPGHAECIDDIWYSGTQRGPRYCVSTAFGARHGEMVAAMATAVAAWGTVTNTWFQYVPASDGACSTTHPLPAGLSFKVSPFDGDAAACAFFPLRPQDGCVASSIVFDLDADIGSFTVPAVMTHELGHVLGMYHEHQRGDAPNMAGCGFFDFRALTPFDPTSVMGYPTDLGNCALGAGLSPSAQDGIGIRQLYGPPPHWLVSASPMFM